MITLSTPSDILIMELEADMEKVRWWLGKTRLSKTYSKPMQKLLDSYHDASIGSESSFSGECQEYLSKNGNKWCLYDYIVKVNGKWAVKVCPFIYWETVGSIGAIVPQDNIVGAKELGCLMLTGHFFQRYCERRKIPFEGKKTVVDFLIGFSYFFNNDDKESGSVIFKANKTGYCYGVRRKDNKKIIEVRTYLEDSTMSRSKKERYVPIDEVSFVERYEEIANKRVF